MIYDIYISEEDENYTEACLDMALEDFEGETWRVEYSFEHESDEISQGGFERAESGSFGIYELCTNKNDIPRWVQVTAMRMKPRIEDILRGKAREPVHEWAQIEEAVG